MAEADAAHVGQSTTPSEREAACDLIAMPSDPMLRAKIRDLMASGILPRVQSDGSLVDEAGRSVPGQRRPTRPCPKCGKESPEHRYRFEHLRMIGWG